MKVLVGCEFSGVVRRAFAARGHEAWSCDLLPAEDGSPKHFQCDVLEILKHGWDLAVFHPPCTYLTCSAEWAYSDEIKNKKMKPGVLTGFLRREARLCAIEFVQKLLGAPIDRICVENPVGVLSSVIRKPDQIVQPYEYGHDASKKTCLWLKNLPKLTPTSYVNPRLVNGKPRWGNQTDSGQNRLAPSSNRWAERSVTYEGIASAMAVAWG